MSPKRTQMLVAVTQNEEGIRVDLWHHLELNRSALERQGVLVTCCRHHLKKWKLGHQVEHLGCLNVHYIYKQWRKSSLIVFTIPLRRWHTSVAQVHAYSEALIQVWYCWRCLSQVKQFYNLCQTTVTTPRMLYFSPQTMTLWGEIIRFGKCEEGLC